PQALPLFALGRAGAGREHLALHLELDLGRLVQVLVPAGVLGRAALRRDDHVAVPILSVDERHRPLLARLPPRRRQEQDGRALPPDVPHRAPGLPVTAHVRFAEQTLCFAHWAFSSRASLPQARAGAPPDRVGGAAAGPPGRRLEPPPERSGARASSAARGS